MTLIPVDTIEWAPEFLLGYGENTRKSYASDLKKFFEFCREHGVDHRFATRAACDAFSRHESEIEGNRPSTVSRRLAAISGYFGYGVAEGYIDRNPVEHIRRPKTNDTQISTGLSKEQLAALISAAEQDNPRSHALILLLSKNGLRISEALNVNIEDFGTEMGYDTLKITRKGGKETKIPLNPKTFGVLSALRGEKTTGPLFETNRGERMNRVGAWRLVRKLGGEKVHPHTLRHTFVTNALEAGCPLQDVQDACDHADPRTTQRYNSSRNRLENHPTFVLDED